VTDHLVNLSAALRVGGTAQDHFERGDAGEQRCHSGSSSAAYSISSRSLRARVPHSMSALRRLAMGQARP